MKDFLLTEDGDLSVLAGDFAVGDSTVDDVYLLVNSPENDFVQFPKACCGLQMKIKTPQSSESIEQIKSSVIEKLAADGKTAVFTGDIDSFKLEVE